MSTWESDQRGGTTRRRLLKAGGAAATASLAGCSGIMNGDEDTEDETTPDDTQDEEDDDVDDTADDSGDADDTNGEDDTGDEEPDLREEYTVPEEFTDEQVENLVKVYERADEEHIVGLLTQEEEFTDEGRYVAELLASEDIHEDFRVNLGTGLNKWDDLDEQEVGVLRTVEEKNDTQIWGNISDLLEYKILGYDTQGTPVTMTAFEKDVLWRIDPDNIVHEIHPELGPMRDTLARQGYTEEEVIEYAELLTERLTQTVNGPYPLIEQMRDEGYLDIDHIQEEDLLHIKDSSENGVINELENADIEELTSEPEEWFSLTNDPYATGLAYAFQNQDEEYILDPEKTMAIGLFETTDNVEPEERKPHLDSALQFHWDQGLQIIPVLGRNNIELPEVEDLSELHSEIRSQLKTDVLYFPVFYTLHGKKEPEDSELHGSVYGISQDERSTRGAYVNIDAPRARGYTNDEWYTLMTAAMISSTLAWGEITDEMREDYVWEFETEEQERSILSFANGQDLNNKDITEQDWNALKENDYGFVNPGKGHMDYLAELEEPHVIEGEIPHLELEDIPQLNEALN